MSFSLILVVSDEGKTIEQINEELQKKTDKTRELVLTLVSFFLQPIL